MTAHSVLISMRRLVEFLERNSPKFLIKKEIRILVKRLVRLYLMLGRK